MTKQYLRQYETVNIEKCRGCRYFTDNGLFEVCGHKEAQYTVGAGEVAQHTCQHMRAEYGPCGPSMKLR